MQLNEVGPELNLFQKVDPRLAFFIVCITSLAALSQTSRHF
jgi:hypothetical protein